MAYIAERKNRAGEVTSYQVKWRPAGTERFDDEPSAEGFRDAGNEAGRQWPPAG
ncbi:hypothetical protein [Streptomyces sp. bgisy091]|uniref:hypothetical protein n=1 Tax=Streptomyces sp. bgisy091 TaxID=3413778 RepID=UPI003D743E32